MIYWEFLGDRYDTYEEAYDACCNEPPEDIEIFQELSNYSSLEMKPLCSTEEIEDIYIAHDASRRDMSHLLIYGDYSDKEIQPYDEFVKFDLIKNDKVEIEICDTVGYLLNDKIYINFIADNLGGVFLNVYEGIRDIKSRYPPSQVADMKNGIQEESGGEIVPKKLDDNLVELYKKYIINSIYSVFFIASILYLIISND